MRITTALTTTALALGMGLGLAAAPTHAALITLPDPAITAATPNAGSFTPGKVFDGAFDKDGSFIENGDPAVTFIEFDFGSATQVTGFDFYQRGDASGSSLNIDHFDLLFSNVADFFVLEGSVTDVDANQGGAAKTEVRSFDITARYVRWQGENEEQSFAGSAEMQFFTTESDPIIPSPSAAFAGSVLLGLAFVRRRRVTRH